MTPVRAVALAAAVCAPFAAAAQLASSVPSAPSPLEDALVAELVREALEKNPEHARARAQVDAERERIPQAGALPDPPLTLGIQNDGCTTREELWIRLEK